MANPIGNGLSTSPRSAPDEISMSKFPKARIGDDVVAQERLLREHFGIEHLELVAGGSMGAQQTYEWAVRFPDKVKRAAPIAGTAQNTLFIRSRWCWPRVIEGTEGSGSCMWFPLAFSGDRS